MKKILFITNNWRFDYGGRRIVSTKIIDNLSKSGFDITVIDFETMSGGQKKYDFKSKVQIKTYSITKNSEIIPHLKYLSLNSHFDLIISCGTPHFDIMVVTTIKLLGYFKGVKTILFAHVHPLKSIKIYSFSIRNIILNICYYVFSHVLYRLFDKIITPSIGLKDFFINHLHVDGKKIIVINNPIINMEHINILLKKNTSSTIKKGLVLITVARLNTFQKDFATLFIAIREIGKKINYRLVILGEGKDKRKIIELSKKFRVSNKIKLVGFKKDPISYISKAHIFIFSSFYEGFPSALIEAMASSVPIIATDCDFGPKEIIENGKNGILVPVGDHKAMANAVEMLYKNNELREKYIKNGLKKIKDYDEIRSIGLWQKFINSEI